jgi:hypothetical protein
MRLIEVRSAGRNCRENFPRMAKLPHLGTETLGEQAVYDWQRVEDRHSTVAQFADMRSVRDSYNGSARLKYQRQVQMAATCASRQKTARRNVELGDPTL